MKKTFHRHYGRTIIIALLCLFLCIVPLANGKVIAREFSEKIDITLYYRVRFEILGQSAKGLHYIDLFDRYTREITQTILNHPSLIAESFSILKAWEPSLAAFVNGQGNEVRITEAQVQEVSAYLDHLGEAVSPELKSVIDTERSISLLETIPQMTMNQAWVYLNQDPRFSVPIPSGAHIVVPDQSLNPVSWMLPESPQYSIDFDPNVWELVSWNNGIATSWELKHRSLVDCVVTVPRVVSDPYSKRDKETKTLGYTPYEVQSARFSEFILYAVYKPLFNSSELSERPQQHEIVFIVYPGYVDTQACTDQSETLLGSIHLSD